MVILVFGYSSLVLARNESTGAGGGVVENGTIVRPNDEQIDLSEETTQNQGEERDLMMRAEDVEKIKQATKSAAPRSAMALEKMSEVAKGVEEILTTRTLKGGIGDQVRLIAQEQKESQDQTLQHVEDVNKRGGLWKKIIGPDYKALNNLEKQVIKNELRIKQLTELMNKLTNQADKTMVQETINALIQQNVSLQEVIVSENKVGSLFGWLAKFLAK